MWAVVCGDGGGGVTRYVTLYGRGVNMPMYILDHISSPTRGIDFGDISTSVRVGIFKKTHKIKSFNSIT